MNSVIFEITSLNMFNFSDQLFSMQFTGGIDVTTDLFIEIYEEITTIKFCVMIWT